jgi:hypothetical protein
MRPTYLVTVTTSYQLDAVDADDAADRAEADGRVLDQHVDAEAAYGYLVRDGLTRTVRP